MQSAIDFHVSGLTEGLKGAIMELVTNAVADARRAEADARRAGALAQGERDAEARANGAALAQIGRLIMDRNALRVQLAGLQGEVGRLESQRDELESQLEATDAEASDLSAARAECLDLERDLNAARAELADSARAWQQGRAAGLDENKLAKLAWECTLRDRLTTLAKGAEATSMDYEGSGHPLNAQYCSGMHHAYLTAIKMLDS